MLAMGTPAVQTSEGAGGIRSSFGLQHPPTGTFAAAIARASEITAAVCKEHQQRFLYLTQ